MKRSLGVLAVCLGLVGGCSVVEKMTTAERTFTISVRNDSAEPVRVGLAKDGTPFEEEWSSPEELAINYAKQSDIQWGILVQPGQTRTFGPVTGRFSETSVGVCRFYQGDPTISEMLSMGRRSQSRIDQGLHPGSNRFVVFDDRALMGVKRLPPEPSPVATSSTK
jgi:hypothetical protein